MIGPVTETPLAVTKHCGKAAFRMKTSFGACRLRGIGIHNHCGRKEHGRQVGVVLEQNLWAHSLIYKQEAKKTQNGSSQIPPTYFVTHLLQVRISCVVRVSTTAIECHDQNASWEECKINFYSPDVLVVLKAYCWVNSPFLALSELWLASSTHLVWLKLLPKLTYANRLLSASDWIALLGLRLTLTICSHLLAASHSMACSVFTCNLFL